VAVRAKKDGPARRQGTTTSNFGVSKRESHDSSGFYERFRAPELSADATVAAPEPVENPFVVGDARNMSAVSDGSVALVVTSPPYFAGKQYEEELEREGVPASYLEYLDMLRDVFRECVRVLEPGGRIAVNVANLGRKPYRSLSADVIGLLQDDLGLLLRGEVIWQKAEGASGSCAWGSFRSPSNPVLRDITERIVIASKGRFDRAVPVKKRAAAGLPHVSTIGTDDFMALTLDVWSIPPESARRVGHPAPFPVELPEQFIRLYTFEDDLVLDPFMGSGSALVAAARLGRRYVGYDLDPEYAELARRRVAEELSAPPSGGSAGGAPDDSEPSRVLEPLAAGQVLGGEDFQSRASREGKAAQKLAEEVLQTAGFRLIDRNLRIRRTGVVVNFVGEDHDGRTWFFDVSGAFTSHRGGLLRTDTVWKSLGRAAVLRSATADEDEPIPVVFLTSHLPKRTSEGDTALRAAGRSVFFDAVEMLSAEGLVRLESYAAGGHADRPLPGFWTESELEARPVEQRN